MPRSPEFGAIALLLFALAVVFALLSMIRYNPPGESDAIPADLRTGIRDSLYVNRPLYFSMTAPAADWSWRELGRDTLFSAADTTALLWPQINWLARLQPAMGGAEIEVGVLNWRGAARIREVTISMLAEVLDLFPDRVRVLQPVSTPAHHVLQGAYFAVVTTEPSAVWVVSVLPRRHWLYVICGRCPEQDYVQFKEVITRTVRRFRPLTMLGSSGPRQ